MAKEIKQKNWKNKILAFLIFECILLCSFPLWSSTLASTYYSGMVDVSLRITYVHLKGINPHYPPESSWSTQERYVVHEATITPEPDKAIYSDGTYEIVIPETSIVLNLPSDPELWREQTIRGGQYKVYVWKMKFDVAITVSPIFRGGAWVGFWTDGYVIVTFRIRVEGARGYYLYSAKCDKIELQGVSADELASVYRITNLDGYDMFDYRANSKALDPFEGANIKVCDPNSDTQYEYPQTLEEIEKYLSLPKELIFVAQVSPTVIKDWLTKNVQGHGATMIFRCHLKIASLKKIAPAGEEYTPINDPTASIPVNWLDYILTHYFWWIIGGLIFIIIFVVILKGKKKSKFPRPKFPFP